MTRTILLSLSLLLAAGCVVRVPGPAVDYEGGVVAVAPPPPRTEVIGVAPSPNHVWVRGYWAWQGRHHVWRPGHWELRRHGEHWVDGHWRAHRNGWVWVPGHWAH